MLSFSQHYCLANFDLDLDNAKLIWPYSHNTHILSIWAPYPCQLASQLLSVWLYKHMVSTHHTPVQNMVVPIHGYGAEPYGGQQVLALTTDNPTVMQAFWRDFQKEFNWVLVWEISSLSVFAAKLVILGAYVDSPMLPTWFEYNNWEDYCIWTHKACYHSICLCGLIF